jgi:hypothetical protein
VVQISDEAGIGLVFKVDAQGFSSIGYVHL